MNYDHWKSTNSADEFLGPEPEDDAHPMAITASPYVVEAARRAAYQDNMREALRYQSLANEMRDVFDDWPLSQRDFEAMAHLSAMLEARAKGLMGPAHGA